MAKAKANVKKIAKTVAKKGAAAFVQHVVTRSKKSGDKNNPDETGTSIWMKILPAGGAFIASQFVTNIAANAVMGKETPTGWRVLVGKHLEVLLSLGVIGGTWYATEKIATLKKYQTEILVGAGLALLVTVAKKYLAPMLLSAPATQQSLPTNTQVAQNTSETVDQEYGEEGDDDEGLTPEDLADYQTGVFAPN